MSNQAVPGPLSTQALAISLKQLAHNSDQYAILFVDQLLSAACLRNISDIHLTPCAEGVEVRWRAEGVLETVGVFPPGASADVITRLKVLADLLTYRQELPQEGRLRVPHAGVEMRVSTFPTLFGERGVVRIFRRTSELASLAALQLPVDLLGPLQAKLQQRSGAVIVTGPAGSGKTTTVYACLRDLVREDRARSVVTLEDPIESVLSGAAQSAMQPAAGFTFATALRSVMRQDPEVILVGEVRDRETAMAAFQAALTGHLVFTTFHAGSVATAISRLNDMGIEPYLLRSGIQALIGQRLLRKLCRCAATMSADEGALGFAVASYRVPQGCEHCSSTGYTGRLVLAEMLPPLVGELGARILAKADAPRIESAARAAGMITLWERAVAAIRDGQTSPSEVRRMLGLAETQPAVDE